MTKILLTSGSSFSFDFYGSEDDPSIRSDFARWPSILSEKLNCQLINKSKPGASNLYIYDHLMENIIKYQDRIELVVAGWSYGYKTSIFRNYELNFINLEDQDLADKTLINTATELESKIQSDGLLVNSIKQSLRLMVYLQEFCESKNIKCVHYPLLNIFKTNLEKQNHLKFLEQIIDCDFFQKIQTYDNVIGWPCDINLGGYTYSTAHPNLVISDKDRHPNEEGQKIIAQEIYDKYLKL